MFKKIILFLVWLPRRLRGKAERLRDRLRGLDFTADRDVGFELDKGNKFYPSDLSQVRKAIRFLYRTCLPLEKLAFFDVGFGKGNILFHARKQGVRRIGGVELSQRMMEICRNNMVRLDVPDFVLYHESATTLEEELDDFNVFYMFNPFQEPLIREFLGNLVASGKRRPRKIYLIYQRPKWHEAVEASGFRKIGVITRPKIYNLEDTVFTNIYVWSEPDELSQ